MRWKKDARLVRNGYLRGPVKDLPLEKQGETLVAEQDLKIHLRLLGVGFYGEKRPDVVTDMALLIDQAHAAPRPEDRAEDVPAAFQPRHLTAQHRPQVPGAVVA